MLLIHQAQHPTSPSLMPPIRLAHHHRRNPSAPAAPVVQVHPTKTPGLLSLSKPQPTRQPPHNAQAQANVRHPTPRQHRTKSLVVKSETPSSEKQQQQQQSQRGRGSPAKDKSARNPSKSRAGHGGRARQPSPTPIPTPPPTEQASVQPSTDSDVAKPPHPFSISKVTPPVLSSPSGRLAKRRNRPPIPFPTSTPTSTPPPTKANNVKAKPVPVPVPQKSLRANNVLPISRSDPVLSHFPHKSLRRAETDVNVAAFPVCDDNDSDDEDLPSTPTKPRGHVAGSRVNATWQQQRSVFDSDGDDENGPRTAPLSTFKEASRNYFPSPTSSPSPLSRRRGAHKRTPSFPTNTLFNPAYDSSSASISDNELMRTQPIDLKALFHRAMVVSSGSSTGTSTPKPKGATVGPAGTKYASSTFQNSPSPEQLPPPSFMFDAMKGEVEKLQL